MYMKLIHLFLLEKLLVEGIFAELIGQSTNSNNDHTRKKRWLLYPPGTNVFQVYNLFQYYCMVEYK